MPRKNIFKLEQQECIVSNKTFIIFKLILNTIRALPTHALRTDPKITPKIVHKKKKTLQKTHTISFSFKTHSQYSFKTQD
jgi:hypothetical protein